MSFPKQRTLKWDANQAGEGVTNYAVTQNGASLGSVASPSIAVTIPSAGTYVFTVVAVNAYDSSDPASLTEIAVKPGVPANVHIED